MKNIIAPDIWQEIQHRLNQVEQTKNVNILMAIESGSRAWGFASPNSDYDVRFIYARERDWYLSVNLEDKRDVIEYPIVDEIDLNGWDVRKALQLFWKSNPAFVEWIQSPITYIESGDFRGSAQSLLPEIYAPERGIYHYRNMAKTNFRGYLREEIVPLKKYFYVLRPLLSVRWLEKYQSPAPIEFHKLLALVPETDLLAAIHALLEKKKVSEEKMLDARVPILNDFIESELERLEVVAPSKSDRKAEMEKLNALFRSVIVEQDPVGISV